jgi:hypothetical protein
VFVNEKLLAGATGAACAALAAVGFIAHLEALAVVASPALLFHAAVRAGLSAGLRSSRGGGRCGGLCTVLIVHLHSLLQSKLLAAAMALALFGLAVLGTLFVHRASGDFLRAVLRRSALFVGFFDVFVLSVAFAAFFNASWHVFLLFTSL